MALQNSQYDALMRYYQRLQFRNKHEQDARIAEAQARIPRLALIDQEISLQSPDRSGDCSDQCEKSTNLTR